MTRIQIGMRCPIQLSDAQWFSISPLIDNIHWWVHNWCGQGSSAEVSHLGRNTSGSRWNVAAASSFAWRLQLAHVIQTWRSPAQKPTAARTCCPIDLPESAPCFSNDRRELVAASFYARATLTYRVLRNLWQYVGEKLWESTSSRWLPQLATNTDTWRWLPLHKTGECFSG